MKRKFITVDIKERKRKLYLDDLTRIHQIIRKAHPKIPNFSKTIRKSSLEEESHMITETFDAKNPEL